MHAESTYVRPARPRPTLVPPAGDDGTRLAALVLALPMRVAATPLGRRVIAAATIAARFAPPEKPAGTIVHDLIGGHVRTLCSRTLASMLHPN